MYVAGVFGCFCVSEVDNLWFVRIYGYASTYRLIACAYVLFEKVPQNELNCVCYWSKDHTEMIASIRNMIKIFYTEIVEFKI